MLIKEADDKTRRLAMLGELRQSSLLDRRQQDWLRDEHHRLSRGLRGEQDAAYYLNNYLKDDPDRAILHDMRLSVDGETIQIDHLILTRGMHAYLLETKNFNGNLHINSRGEFSVEYRGERMLGIPSPIEQSRRHEGPLQKVFQRLGIVGFSGAAPLIHHCVLVNPQSLIHRPKPADFDTSMVIKADQFRAWHEQFIDRAVGMRSLLGAVANIRSSHTLRDFAEKLLRAHRPVDQLALPDFMRPAPAASGEGSVAPLPPKDQGAGLRPVAKKLICAHCDSKISYAEGKYCWNNEARFGGLQYCREHQALIS